MLWCVVFGISSFISGEQFVVVKLLECFHDRTGKENPRQQVRAGSSHAFLISEGFGVSSWTAAWHKGLMKLYRQTTPTDTAIRFMQIFGRGKPAYRQLAISIEKNATSCGPAEPTLRRIPGESTKSVEPVGPHVRDQPFEELIAS
jgi:hypothetical protein